MITRKKLEQLSLICELQESMIMYQQSGYFSNDMSITFTDIINFVSEYSGISIELMKSGSRETTIKTARFFCIYFLRRMLPREQATLTSIGLYFGGRDHSTSINSIRAVTERLTNDFEEDNYKKYHKDLCLIFGINPEDDIIKAAEEYNKRKLNAPVYKQKKIIKFPKKIIQEKIVPFVRESGWVYSNKNHCAI